MNKKRVENITKLIHEQSSLRELKSQVEQIQKQYAMIAENLASFSEVLKACGEMMKKTIEQTPDYSRLSHGDFIILALTKHCKNNPNVVFSITEVNHFFEEYDHSRPHNPSGIMANLRKRGLIRLVDSKDSSSKKYYTLTLAGIEYGKSVKADPLMSKLNP